jgi:hypothetical protein
MANNYTQFSQVIENLTKEEHDWIEETLEERFDIGNDEWLGDYFDHQLYDDYIWFYSEEACSVDGVMDFVQEFLTKFRPNDVFSMEWADYCSKPRVGEFGGGACVVTKDEIHFIHTNDWVYQKLAEIKDEPLQRPEPET